MTVLKNNIPANPEDLGSGIATVAADLSYGSASISVTSIPGAALPARVTSRIQPAIDELTAECSAITLVIPSSSGMQTTNIAFEKMRLATDAENTYSFKEIVEGPGGTAATVTVVRAIQDNVVIGATGTATDQTVFPTLVNAVVAAIKASRTK